MHGELLEFNDVLKKQLLISESQLKRMTNELVALRGPVSTSLITDVQVSDERKVMASNSMWVDL